MSAKLRGMAIGSLDDFLEFCGSFRLHYGHLDDCAWMNGRTIDRLRRSCALSPCDIPNLDVMIAGVKIFEDNDLVDGAIETGTYKVVNGALKKTIHHQFPAAQYSTSANPDTPASGATK